MQWKAKPVQVKDADGWYPYFTWFPTKIGDTWVWLEWVERHTDDLMYGYDPQYIHEYRLPLRTVQNDD